MSSEYNKNPYYIMVAGSEAKLVMAAKQVDQEAMKRAELAADSGMPALITYDTEYERSVIGKRFALERFYRSKNSITGPIEFITSFDAQTPSCALPPASTAMIPSQTYQVNTPRFITKAPSDMELAAIFCSKVTLRRYGENVWHYDYVENTYKKLSDEQLRTLVVQMLREELSITGQARQISNLISVVLAEPTIQLPSLEQAGNLQWVKNGVLNIANGILHPHSPEYFLTTQLQTEWLGPKDCPWCDYFFASVSGGNPILTERLWQTLGYVLMPDNNAKRFVLLQGASDSGKSVFGELISAFFHMEDIGSLDIFRLGERFAPSMLIGKRVNLCMDLSDSHLEKKAISFIKAVTGRDFVPIEEKFKAIYTAKLDVKLVFGTNHRLRIDSADPAFWNRILLLPFENVIPKENQIRDLAKKLATELPGILFKAVCAYKTVINNNYRFAGDDIYSFAVSSHIGDPIMDADSGLNEFIQNCCLPNPAGFTSTEALHNAYLVYCRNVQIAGISDRIQFSRRFKEIAGGYFDLQLTKKRVYGVPVNGYKGVLLN